MSSRKMNILRGKHNRCTSKTINYTYQLSETFLATGHNNSVDTSNGIITSIGDRSVQSNTQ